MMIAANALDLGSCWINQLKWLTADTEDPALLQYLTTLGMENDERVYGAMILGSPDTHDGKPQRKPLERKGNEVTRI
ncbi:MAG: hypothetical protein J5861_06510 [Desulfovibrio sp.]|nr:hypothetical protein [Desulfovibrio sp.]